MWLIDRERCAASVAADELFVLADLQLGARPGARPEAENGQPKERTVTIPAKGAEKPDGDGEPSERNGA